jgi:predicted metal-dependent phosphoesterase TrpH
MEEHAMRCDLHVHSVFSGPAELPVVGRVGRESYSDPREVYGVARRRGMDLVTLTDHDSIEGALAIAHLPGTFVSEEVTCRLAVGRELHLGVYDIDEAQHAHIASRRCDPEALFAYLAEERIPTCANHLFSALTGTRRTEDLLLALSRLRLIETRNGMMPAGTNELARRAGRACGLSPIGGSDAHTLASVARAFTLVPGAREKQEFLDGLRRRATIAVGRSGSYARLTADVARLAALSYEEGFVRARRSAREALAFALRLPLLPALVVLPLVTAALAANERLFGARQFRRLEAEWARPLGAGTAGKRLGAVALGAR